MGVTGGEVLTAQVHLEPLDGALYSGAFAVSCSVSGEMLGMLPVDLRLVVPSNANVSSLALSEATASQRATRTYRQALVIVGSNPDVALLVYVASSKFESMFTFAHWYTNGREAVDPFELVGERCPSLPAMHRHDQSRPLTELFHRILILTVGIVCQYVAYEVDDVAMLLLQQQQVRHQGLATAAPESVGDHECSQFSQLSLPHLQFLHIRGTLRCFGFLPSFALAWSGTTFAQCELAIRWVVSKDNVSSLSTTALSRLCLT